MTVGVTARHIDYTANGVATTFAIPFQFFEVEVLVNGALTTSYSIVQVSAGDTGSIVFVTAPTAGARVKIKSATIPKQDVDYINNGQFSASSHELALDRAELGIQDLREIVDGKFDVTDLKADPGKLLVSDATVGIKGYAPPRAGFVTTDSVGHPDVVDISAGVVYTVSRELLDSTQPVVAGTTLPGLLPPVAGVSQAYVDAQDAILAARILALETAGFATQAWVLSKIAAVGAGASTNDHLNWWYNQGYTWSAEWWSTHVWAEDQHPFGPFDLDRTWQLGFIQHLVKTGVTLNAPPATLNDQWHVMVLGHTPDSTLAQFAYPHEGNVDFGIWARWRHPDLSWSPWIRYATTADVQAVANDLAAEIVNRIAGDTFITNNLTTEINNRIAGDNAEAAARIAGDTFITNNLAAEIAARTAADTTLTTNLAAEVARATASEAALAFTYSRITL